MSETRREKVAKVQWRKVLDRLDDALHDADALADPAIFEARRALGRAIGCLVVSAETGERVTITARSYPPFNENGAMQAPGTSTARWSDAIR